MWLLWGILNFVYTEPGPKQQLVDFMSCCTYLFYQKCVYVCFYQEEIHYCSQVQRRVARNFDRGGQTTTKSQHFIIWCKIWCPLFSKHHSQNVHFFWCFFLNNTVYFIEVTNFKIFFSEVSSFSFGWKPPFARKTFMQERLWKSQWF